MEAQQRLGGLVAAHLAVGVEKPAADPGAAEPLALEEQEGQLVGRIEHPELGGELEAVDDRGLRREADVFGAQVAVALDDAAFVHALVEQSRLLGEEAELGLRELMHPAAAESELGPAELAQIVAHAARESAAIRRRGESERPRVRVEPRDVQRGGPNVRLAERPAQDQRVEHPVRREPPHVHEPVDRLARSREREPGFEIERQLDRAQVDVPGEPSIEPYLLLAVALAQGRRAEVEAVPAHRLLQLVDVASREEHPRHVGLHRVDGPRRRRVGLRPAQEGHLGLDAGLVHAAPAAGFAYAAACSSSARTSSSPTWSKSA
jgi:hypothetical protein